MRASANALIRSASLFEAYLQCMEKLGVFRTKIASSDESNLAESTLQKLIQYQFDRCLGAYCLIINGLVWDAEIIVRSVYETSAKVLLIASAIGENRNTLVSEFWDGLAAIYDKKGADKAEIAKRIFAEESENDVRIFEALQDPSLFAVEAMENKRSRDKIEQRWAFSNIVKRLSQTSAEHRRIVGFDALTHMYGMMSHLAHASPKALDLMEDRATRGEDLVALETAHISRMLSDLVHLTGFSLRFAYASMAGSLAEDDPLNSVVEIMHEASAQISAKFHSSQDGLYRAKTSGN